MIPGTNKTVFPDKPDFPKISLPEWTSAEIRLVIEKHLAHIKTQQQVPIEIRQMNDLYACLVRVFNKVKKVFFDTNMKSIWEKLNSLSKEKAAIFASQLLFRIENDYDGGLNLIEKHMAEIGCGEQMISTAKKLHEEMDNYQYWFYGHIIQENHNEVTEILKNFIQNSTTSLEEFKKHIKSDSYLFSGLYPINRKSNDKKFLPIFYMRKIYLLFVDLFETPMYANVADIVNIIFETEYTENHAVKYCASVRPFRSDDSKQE